MTRFTIAMIAFVLLQVAFLVGIIAQAPALVLGYLCLAPWAGIVVGRFSVRI